MSPDAPLRGLLIMLAITAPWFIAVSLANPEFARFFFIHDGGDHPAHRAFVIAHGFARRQTIGGNNHALMHSGAVRINRDLRHTFRIARAVNRLANDQPPPLQAGMLAGRHDIAFDTS